MMILYQAQTNIKLARRYSSCAEYMRCAQFLGAHYKAKQILLFVVFSIENAVSKIADAHGQFLSWFWHFTYRMQLASRYIC